MVIYLSAPVIQLSFNSKHLSSNDGLCANGRKIRVASGWAWPVIINPFVCGTQKANCMNAYLAHVVETYNLPSALFRSFQTQLDVQNL